MMLVMTATLLLLIDGVFSRIELIVDEKNQLLITPPGFSLEVPPGATVLMGLELNGVPSPDFRPSPSRHCAFGHGWHVRDAWRPAPGDSEYDSHEPGDVYTLSYDLNIEALLPPQILPPRRVLDTRLLSGVAEAHKYSIPSLSGENRLQWLDLLEPAGGEIVDEEEVITFYQPVMAT